jgi:hypothetical protein
MTASTDGPGKVGGRHPDDEGRLLSRRAEQTAGGGTPALGTAMVNSVRTVWAIRTPYQTFLYTVGALLLASGFVHSALWLAKGGSWVDPVSWRKPTLFGVSFGLTAVAIAWVHTYLTPRRGWGWAFCGAFGLAGAGEVALITMQQWRGVASHFNRASPFDARVFLAMGALVAIVAIVIVAVTVRALVRLYAPPSMKLAIRAGLVLLVVGQVLGGTMLSIGGTQIQVGKQDFLGAEVFGAHGLMKVPHAVALHAIEVLPAIAWLLLFTALAEQARTRLVGLAVAGYSGLTAVNALQTFRGLAPLELDILAGVLLLSSMVLLGATALATVLKLWEAGHASRTPT